jgi:hypothetical protein
MKTFSSAWASGNNLNTTRTNLAGAGTQTSALGFGGAVPVTGATEEYDGTSWTNSNSLNTARQQLGGAGIQTAALAFGGQPLTGATEEYDGNSWTSSNPLNTARLSLAGSRYSNCRFSFWWYCTTFYSSNRRI